MRLESRERPVKYCIFSTYCSSRVTAPSELNNLACEVTHHGGKLNTVTCKICPCSKVTLNVVKMCGIDYSRSNEQKIRRNRDGSSPDAAFLDATLPHPGLPLRLVPETQKDQNHPHWFHPLVQ